MATVLPHARGRVHLHHALHVHQNHTSVLEARVQKDQLKTVNHFAIGRSVENCIDLSHWFFQVIEIFLDYHRCTAFCCEEYSPAYSLPMIRSTGLQTALETSSSNATQIKKIDFWVGLNIEKKDYNKNNGSSSLCYRDSQKSMGVMQTA